MATKYLLVFLLLGICLSFASEINEKKHKKHHKHVKNIEEENEIEDEDDEAMKIAEEKAKLQEMMTELEEEVEEEEEKEIKKELEDPCSKVHCGAGRVCEIDDNEEPNCVCISECSEETEARRKVCSNYNETWPSDCSIYQQRCWCSSKDERCKDEKYRHIHIEYYGVCRNMPECKEEEMADFPRRMRDWLFNVMRDLADRRELTPHYYNMEKEAETNLTRRWVNAAIWKWCDLDMSHDRTVSRHELFPIRAPLMYLEHCIAPFLDSCDSDNNHKITLKEWGKCLHIDEDELEDRCDAIEENNIENPE